MKCEKCGKNKHCVVYRTYHPNKQEYRNHDICAECIHSLIESYFDETKSGSW